MIRALYRLVGAALAAALLLLFPGCTQCNGKSLLAAKPTRIRSVFTSIGPYAGGGALSGEFVMNVPANLAPGEKPGLMITFHADGRARKGWNDPGALDRLARTGERFHLVTVAMQEP